jgi:hypothetical protein
MGLKRCKEKCWLTEDGKTLVPDGDEKSSKLFASEGMTLPEGDLEGIKGADKFFEDLNPTSQEEEQDLEDYTVDQLKEMADDKGVEIQSGMLKADIIKAIKKSRK